MKMLIMLILFACDESLMSTRDIIEKVVLPEKRDTR